ncbi:MAG: urease accessory protein UreF [Pseudomonadota bacterium]|nr:urease accessory protein UreF [Pseudomonadota bacterium]
MTTLPVDPALLVRLLQLASPALPVGGFSYSQGLEAAIDTGWVSSAGQTRDWLQGLLAGPVGHAEARWLARLLRAWREGQPPDVLARLDALYQASREGSQLLAETRQMAWSLLRLLAALPAELPGPRLPVLLPVLQTLAAQRPPAYPLVWSCLAVGMAIDDASAVQAWLWTWLENQVMVAIKTIPLGQNAGQALLFELAAQLPALAQAAVAQAAYGACDDDPAEGDDDGPGNFAPGFALACTRHETQYSRLFRS